MPFFENLLQKIKEHVRIYDSPTGSHDTLRIVCRLLRGQVVPILQVLTDMNESPEGHAFIQQLDLNKLISRLNEIDKLEKSLTGAELRVRIDAEARKDMIGDLGTKFKPVPSYSLQPAMAHNVIGGIPTIATGGRRTKRHKRSGKRSGHKRSGKRSGHKRSGKRSNKRSGHKSRRR